MSAHDRVLAQGTPVVGLPFHARRSVKSPEAVARALGCGRLGILGDEDPEGTGFLLVDLTLKPIYASHIATSILNYPDGPDARPGQASVQERIRSVLQVGSSFVSGRRRYVWRAFLVESLDPAAAGPIFAVTFERRTQQRPMVAEIARRFHLSGRETETVRHLMQGLTTREAAQRMNVSPNTVKQFIRLIMSKMNVATRSAMIAKLVGS